MELNMAALSSNKVLAVRMDESEHKALREQLKFVAEEAEAIGCVSDGIKKIADYIGDMFIPDDNGKMTITMSREYDDDSLFIIAEAFFNLLHYDQCKDALVTETVRDLETKLDEAEILSRFTGRSVRFEDGSLANSRIPAEKTPAGKV